MGTIGAVLFMVVNKTVLKSLRGKRSIHCSPNTVTLKLLDGQISEMSTTPRCKKKKKKERAQELSDSIGMER